MTTKRIHGTSNGYPITDAVIDRLVTEAEDGYDIALLKPRPGRKSIGLTAAEVVPVRLNPELKLAVEQRAAADKTTSSDIIRQALREFLNVA
jgi:Ribbon-helix-helix protein, copG family